MCLCVCLLIFVLLIIMMMIILYKNWLIENFLNKANLMMNIRVMTIKFSNLLLINIIIGFLLIFKKKISVFFVRLVGIEVLGVSVY